MEYHYSPFFGLRSFSNTDPYSKWLRTDRDAPLSPDSLRHLVRRYGFMAADWRQLGLQLGVPNDKLREIQANHAGHPNQSQLCLTDMFDWWLKNTPNPTFGQVSGVICYKYPLRMLQKEAEMISYLLKTETETETGSEEPSQPQVEKKSRFRKIWGTFQCLPIGLPDETDMISDLLKTETETESEEPSQPQVEKKSGFRKIWGTFQCRTADFVKSALGKLSGLFASLDVRRKYKKSRDVVRWWFEVEGDESKLRALERVWGAIQASTQWKLE